MSNRSANANTHYVVGYRKPPANTQFRRGQSGNPRGRPKGSASLHALIDSALSQSISITENGKERKIEAGEALVRSTVARAIKGDQKAVSNVLRLATLRDQKREEADAKVAKKQEKEPDFSKLSSDELDQLSEILKIVNSRDARE